MKPKYQFASYIIYNPADLSGCFQKMSDDGWELFRDFTLHPKHEGLDSKIVLIYRKEQREP